MIKRRFRRFPVSSNVVIMSGGRKYVGSIRNVSEEGIGCLISDYIHDAESFSRGELVSLLFFTPSRNTLGLNCEIRWLSGLSSVSEKKYMGAKVINPPAGYRKLIGSFSIQHD